MIQPVDFIERKKSFFPVSPDNLQQEKFGKLGWRLMSLSNHELAVPEPVEGSNH